MRVFQKSGGPKETVETIQKVLLLSIFVVSFFISRPAGAQILAENCDTFPNVPVDVRTVFVEPVVVNTIGIVDLQQRNVPDQKIYESILIGLTTYKDASHVEIDAGAVELPNGLSCVKVRHVAVTIGYSNATIYVPTQVDADSCGGQQVVGHELKHLATYRNELLKSVPLIQSRMNEYLKLNGMFKEDNYTYALSLLQDNVHKMLDEINQGVRANVETSEAAIDTPQESSRLGNSCNNQLMTAARFLQ